MSDNRSDLYQRVTDRIIAQLESGVLPWVQPWRNGASPRARGVALPHNAVSGRPYSGINIVLLWDAGEVYGSHGWLTFKQALELGGHVRKGEHGTMVVYADRFIPKGERARVEAEGGDARAVYFLKSYIVFNREQCEGLPAEGATTVPTMPEMIASADALIRNSRAQIAIGGDRAAYFPAFDRITLPSMAAYAPNEINWYRTALHELTHWTGHESRLARKFGFNGSGDYAREELIAEMGAAFTCASLGIEPTVRHVDYIGSWLNVLREDNRAIVQAASKASKAADYLLAFADAVEMKEAA